MNGLTRNRFAPSPTGHAHIGGMRTALFEWLFARSTDGIFVLRIEDTDRTRYVEDAVHSLMRAMRWLGLQWDEGPEMGGAYGPYFQSQRLHYYQQAARALIESGQAYYCYCSKERLDEVRKAQQERGEPTGYDRHCRNMTPEQRAECEAQGITPVVRFAVPLEGETRFTDRVRGEIVFEHRLLDDFVLLKSDGYPVYHLANVVDDHLMEITHVLRAEEWLPSTPKHVLLYKAFGWDPPQWVHLPLVLGPDRSKLSKRHGATDVDAYRLEGYLPEAIINFLALLGWSPGENREIFSVEELINRFSIEGITPHPAVFDITKLQWMNGEYIRMMEPKNLALRVLPFLVEENMYPENPGPGEMDYLVKVVTLLQERMKLLKDIVWNGEFFFLEDIHYDDKAVNKWLKTEETGPILTAALQALHDVEDWSLDKIESAVRQAIANLNLPGGGEMIHRLRSSITGRTMGPSLFETMEVLGRDRCLSRIRFTLQTYAGVVIGD